MHEIGEHHAVAVLHDGALRDGNHQILARPPVAALALPVGTARGPTMRVIAEAEQRGHVAICDKPHIAAVTPVTTVGSAFGHVCLAPERDGARATVTGLHMEATLVDEAGHPVRLRAQDFEAGVT